MDRLNGFPSTTRYRNTAMNRGVNGIKHLPQLIPSAVVHQIGSWQTLMHRRWLSVLPVLGFALSSGLMLPAPAQSTSSPSAPSVEERLSTIEGKLRSLESRLEQAVLQDAHLDFNYLPGAKIRFGKFKAPVGLERLQAARDFLFVERGFPTSLVPNRDVGVQLVGDNLEGGVLNYAVGIFNGAPDGSSGDQDTNNTKDFAGRIFVYPFRKTGIGGLEGLGVWISGTKGSQQGALPTLKTSGQSTFFSYSTGVVASGDLHRLSPQAYYYWGPLGLLGEYVQSVQDVKRGATLGEIKNQAWQVEGTFVLTGEKASYRAVTPKKAFDPHNGSFGALELTGRYGRLNVDNDAFILKFADPTKSASEANAWLVGINWYFARNLKFVSTTSKPISRVEGPQAIGRQRKSCSAACKLAFESIVCSLIEPQA